MRLLNQFFSRLFLNQRHKEATFFCIIAKSVILMTILNDGQGYENPSKHQYIANFRRDIDELEIQYINLRRNKNYLNTKL